MKSKGAQRTVRSVKGQDLPVYPHGGARGARILEKNGKTKWFATRCWVHASDIHKLGQRWFSGPPEIPGLGVICGDILGTEDGSVLTG